MPVIGFLGIETSDLYIDRIRAFRQGLSENGYVEGQNVTVDYRWAKGKSDRLKTLASDLVARPVAIVVAGGEPGRGRPRRRLQKHQLSSSVGAIR